MKKLIVAFAFLITVPAIADDEPPIVNVEVNVSTGANQFVGFSIGTISGSQGIVSMHALCQLDFGPDARMCISEEYFTSATAAEPLSRAWLHPTIVGNSLPSTSSSGLTDFSGVSSERFRTLNCNGWQRGATDLGLALEALSAGKPVFNSCADPIAVTCCAPAE